ncbi:MAG: alpha/beta hydrolase [Pilosibacter sp.]
METSLKKPIQTGEFRKNPVEPAWRCPGDYIYELVPTEKFVMEYLKPKQAVTGRVVLQLHGGGYIGPMKNIYRRFAVKYSELGLGADVLTPDYRVAPEHPFPAALEDAVYAYKWLLNEKKYDPEQIVVAGDSAGGGLALALCLYAKDHALPLPAGIITMSPWTDVTLSGASYEENYTIDPLFGNSKENMLYQCSYIGNADKKDPYLSPLFGNFEGFPPMLMQVGAYEVLLDDTRTAAKKAREEGVKVRCSVYDGMFHVFQMGLDLIPESREAWEEVGESPAHRLPHPPRPGGKGRKKGEDEAKRHRRAGETESSGIFKTGAEKQMIIKKPSFLSFHEAGLFPALSACVILKTPV